MTLYLKVSIILSLVAGSCHAAPSTNKELSLKNQVKLELKSPIYEKNDKSFKIRESQSQQKTPEYQELSSTRPHKALISERAPILTKTDNKRQSVYAYNPANPQKGSVGSINFP